MGVRCLLQIISIWWDYSMDIWDINVHMHESRVIWISLAFIILESVGSVFSEAA